MPNICCFLDVQGYHANSMFYMREVAILCSNSTLHSSVKDGFKEKDILPDDNWAIHLEKDAIIGLPIEAGEKDLSIDQVKALVKTFYDNCVTGDAFLCGYTSKDSEDLLRSLRIPRIQLEIEGPRNHHCQLHNVSFEKKFDCSLVNVQRMFDKYRYEMC